MQYCCSVAEPRVFVEHAKLPDRQNRQLVICQCREKYVADDSGLRAELVGRSIKSVI